MRFRQPDQGTKRLKRTQIFLFEVQARFQFFLSQLETSNFGLIALKSHKGVSPEGTLATEYKIHRTPNSCSTQLGI
jgi:hypothetical protein